MPHQSRSKALISSSAPEPTSGCHVPFHCPGGPAEIPLTPRIESQQVRSEAPILSRPSGIPTGG